MNYLEPDDEDVVFNAQKLVNGALKLDNFPPIRELERIKYSGEQALQLTQFSTTHEKTMAESLQRNTNAWIDTAKDVLCVVIDISVTTAAEEHRNDLKKFQQGKVNVNVPHQSHAKLLESIKQAEQNQASNVRVIAERSSLAWDIAKSVGMIVLTVGIILGFAILKH